jgi:AcrR family transcriptional regulator
LSTPNETTPRLRADAQRNRDRLLESARDAFATADGDVSLETIAANAGVGIGTLYRNFPTREALVAAVYRRELDEVTALAPDLLQGRTGLEALVAWIERYRFFVETKHGMQDTLRVAWTAGTVPVPETRARVTGAIAELVTAGITDGSIRSEVRPDDVTAALVGSFIATRQDPEQAARVVDIIVEGLRARH